MKCRRRAFGQITAATEHYWDRKRNRVITTSQHAERGGGERAMRRNAMRNIRRTQSNRKSSDNRIDKLIALERDYGDRVERVGDKFRILDDE